MKLTRLWLLVFLSSTAVISGAQQSTMPPYHQLAHDIFQQLIEINTTDTAAGNVTTAAQAVAARLQKAGFTGDDLRLGGPLPNKYNVVARIHGSSKARPVLFIGHLDVVQALKQDWSPNLDPFKFNEIDGYFYGRGTSDIKQGDAILVTNFIRLKQEGLVPNRDLILALTADEEGGESNGIQWLLKNHRDWIDAEYCINTDAGDFETENGKRLLLGVETSEKNYIDFQLEVKSRGGHSSRPVKDNAIYHLAGGLERLSNFNFPVELNETTRSFFSKTASLQDAQTGADFRAVSANQPDPAAM
jgi:acetylornithine deacetylase/succinyl-diaminopimelate desuccinylase-like protein